MICSPESKYHSTNNPLPLFQFRHFENLDAIEMAFLTPFDFVVEKEHLEMNFDLQTVTLDQIWLSFGIQIGGGDGLDFLEPRTG